MDDITGDTAVARGRRFEALAAEALVLKGYRVLARNVRHGPREVDLVVEEPGGTVAFVEVKGRTRSGWGHPLERIHRKKRRDVEAVARWWIRTAPPATGYRFDAVAVEATGDPQRPWRILHLPDAWRPMMEAG
ncbi:MAG: YraN family protein [Gemmatimonadota bacterium]